MFRSSLIISSNLCINNLDCRLSLGSFQLSSSSNEIDLEILLRAALLSQLMSIGILTISEMFLTTNSTQSCISLFITKKSAEIKIGITVLTSSFGFILCRYSISHSKIFRSQWTLMSISSAESVIFRCFSKYFISFRRILFRSLEIFF
jgi:hypothetical protein